MYGTQIGVEAVAIHTARLQAEGVAVVDQVIHGISARRAKAAPVVHLSLVPLLGSVRTAGQKVQVHIACRKRLLEVQVGLNVPVRVVRLVQNIEAAQRRVARIPLDLLADDALGFAGKTAAEAAVLQDQMHPVLLAQLQHFLLVCRRSKRFLARAQYPVDAGIRHQPVLLIIYVGRCGRPEDGQHDVLVKVYGVTGGCCRVRRHAQRKRGDSGKKRPCYHQEREEQGRYPPKDSGELLFHRYILSLRISTVSGKHAAAAPRCAPAWQNHYTRPWQKCQGNCLLSC